MEKSGGEKENKEGKKEKERKDESSERKAKREESKKKKRVTEVEEEEEEEEGKEEEETRKECNGTLDKTRREHERAFTCIESTGFLWMLVDDRVRVTGVHHRSTMPGRKNARGHIVPSLLLTSDYSSHVPSYYPLCGVDERGVSHFFKLVNSLQASSFERELSSSSSPFPTPTPLPCPPCSRCPVQFVVQPGRPGRSSCIVQKREREREREGEREGEREHARGIVQITIVITIMVVMIIMIIIIIK